MVGKNLGVANAIVYLEGIRSGKPMTRRSSYVMTQKNCEFVPHVVLVPLGERLEIVNFDPILHNVHALDSEAEPKTLFILAQPVKNLRTKTRPMTRAGIISVQCDAGHPWMSATVKVIEHPYHAITGSDGSFRLEDIPPGTYQLRLWHEGVNILGRQLEHDKVTKYQFEKAYIDSLPMTIQPRTNSKADFELVLR